MIGARVTTEGAAVMRPVAGGQPTPPTYRPLHDGWTLSAAGREPIPAQVPGCVHTDLLAAGLIDDPYLDDNETRLAWIGRTGWEYETTFVWTPTSHDRTDLVCDGPRHGRHGRAQRRRGREYGQPAPLATASPVRHLLRDGDEHARGSSSTPPYDVRRGAAGRARRPAGPLRRAVPVHPQDGLQLRLGLGADAGHRRHLAADRPASRGAVPGWRRSGRWCRADGGSMSHVERRARPPTAPTRRSRCEPSAG